jgi:TusA-related sulfurtransferase
LLRSAAGSLFDIAADDPLAAVDIQHMCAQESFDVLSVHRDGACVRLKLRRPIAPSSAPPSDQAAK